MVKRIIKLLMEFMWLGRVIFRLFIVIVVGSYICNILGNPLGITIFLMITGLSYVFYPLIRDLYQKKW